MRDKLLNEYLVELNNELFRLKVTFVVDGACLFGFIFESR